MRCLILGFLILCSTLSAQTIEHKEPGLVEASVGHYGYLANQQFLYAYEPPVIGADMRFLMTYTSHEPGLYLLMLSDKAWVDGPWVSLDGGPLTQLLIAPPNQVLGPFRHDGIQSELLVPVPDNVALLGRIWYAQAVVSGGYIDLSSALGGVIGNYY